MQCVVGWMGVYPLFLTGHERLESWSHTESQLIDEGRLVLRVELNFNPGLKRRLVCRDKNTRMLITGRYGFNGILFSEYSSGHHTLKK